MPRRTPEGRGGKLPLLDVWHRSSTWHDWRKDIALHRHTQGQRNDVQKKKISCVSGGGLSGEDTGLDGGTVGNSLIGVDALLELLAVEEVAEELLDARNTGRATNKHDLVDGLLLNTSILQDLLHRLDSAVESLGVDVLESSPGNIRIEVLTVEQRVDFDSGLGGVGKSPLGTLAGCAQPSEGTRIAGDVLLGLLLELVLEVVEEIRVEILST